MEIGEKDNFLNSKLTVKEICCCENSNYLHFKQQIRPCLLPFRFAFDTFKVLFDSFKWDDDDDTPSNIASSLHPRLFSLLSPGPSLSGRSPDPALTPRPSVVVVCTVYARSHLLRQGKKFKSQFVNHHNLYGLLAKASKHGTDFQTSNFLVEFDKTMTKNIGLL